MNPVVIDLVNFFISQKTAKAKDGSISYLHIHETIGRLARFYEALRNAVDLKEEHLLRRNAIERILKRLIIFENISRKNMGRELLIELIRAGYLSNDALPDVRVQEFEKIINRYIRIIKGIEEPAPLKTKLQNWLISVASVEIEEKLNPEQLAQEKIITRLVFGELLPAVAIRGVSELEAKTQLFIAILKTILKADEAALRLRLLGAHCQGFDLDDSRAVAYLTKNLVGLSILIEKEIKNKLNVKFSCAIKKFAPIFWVFSDFIKETAMLTLINKDDLEKNSYSNNAHPAEQKSFTPLNSREANSMGLNDEYLTGLAPLDNEGLEKQNYSNNAHPAEQKSLNSKYLTGQEELKENILLKIKNEEHINKVVGRICDRRYFEAKMRLWRTTKKSIIFLLLTKTILAFVLELPYGLYILKKVNHFSLFVNVIFHPFLLGMIASAIKIPGKENTSQIIKGIKELMSPDSTKEIFRSQVIIQRGRITNITLNFIYAFISLLIFILLIWGLYELHFNPVSITLFCFFLSLVSFLGWRSRQAIQEMFVAPQSEKFLPLLLDFFALPIISLGGWLTKKLPKFNVFTIIMDFLIEAPFQVIVGGLESWARFTKEKREEIEV